MKIRPVGAELVYADGWTDGQTDMTKSVVAFRSFANAPKNCRVSSETKDVFYGTDSCILHSFDYKIRRFGESLGINVNLSGYFVGYLAVLSELQLLYSIACSGYDLWTVLVTRNCILVYTAMGRFLSFARNRQNTTGHSGLDTCTVYRVALCCISDQHLNQLQTPTRSQPANRTPHTALCTRRTHEPDYSEVVNPLTPN